MAGRGRQYRDARFADKRRFSIGAPLVAAEQFSMSVAAYDN
jgi:hypothetical protein